MARRLQLREAVNSDMSMPNKITIQVRVDEPKLVRPLKPLGLLFLELRSRLGLGKPTKFRSSVSADSLPEVSPPESKRVRG